MRSQSQMGDVIASGQRDGTVDAGYESVDDSGRKYREKQAVIMNQQAVMTIAHT